LSLAGCDSDAPTGQLDSHGVLSMAIPERIRNASAVNLSAVTATATVNGESYPMNLSGGRFIATIPVQSNGTLTVSLRFEERLDSGVSITLASASKPHTVNGQSDVLNFTNEDFNTDFDDDADGLTNIREREIGTDPITADQFSENRNLTLTFSIPGAIPFPAVTQPRVQVANIPRGVEIDGLTYTSRSSVTTLSPVTVEVILQQRIPQTVFLARSITEVPAGFDNVSVQLNDNDFDFSLDNDGDGRTNIEEVRNGTNPFVPD